MTDLLEFTCTACGAIHEGIPAWHFDAPDQALALSAEGHTARVELTQDDCIIDGAEFYLKGLLEIPIHGVSEPFTRGAWVSVSEESYQRFAELFNDPGRDAGESFFGWLCNWIPGYQNTRLLKTQLHIREYPMRPRLELEPTDHPLAIHQRDGIGRDRAVEMAESMLHPKG